MSKKKLPSFLCVPSLSVIKSDDRDMRVIQESKLRDREEYRAVCLTIANKQEKVRARVKLSQIERQEPKVSRIAKGYISAPNEGTSRESLKQATGYSANDFPLSRVIPEGKPKQKSGKRQNMLATSKNGQHNREVKEQNVMADVYRSDVKLGIVRDAVKDITRK